MSIIFPLFGTGIGVPQNVVSDGYYLSGTTLRRFKSESFTTNSLFSNVDGFFVDRRESLYISQGGSVKKYLKNFSTGNFSLAWQVSGGFVGGSKSGSDDDYLIKSYPFISDFQNVAVDSQFNFYFRDTTDSNKLKKYSAGGQLITSTSSDIGTFAVNKDNIISLSGNTVTKRDLSGNSVSSFTVTGSVRAVNSDRVFSFDNNDEEFVDNSSNTLRFGKIYSYNLSDGSLAWSRSRIFSILAASPNVIGYQDFIPLQNGNILIRIYGQNHIQVA